MVVRPTDRLIGYCSCGWVTIVERYEQLQDEMAEHLATQEARPHSIE
jgi:hypothetical protein